MPAPTGNRPYVIRILRFANGADYDEIARVTVTVGARLAKAHDLSPAGRHTPRSSCTYPDGSSVEFRYVDPRPGAPDCISPRTQEF